MLSTVSGTAASRLGLAAQPDQDRQCVRRAFDTGINYFFFYGPGHRDFIDGVKSILPRRREEMILATGSGARSKRGLPAARRKILAAAGSEMLDIFFAEYINPGDNADAVFGEGGVLDELQQWKAAGSIRYVGATAHDRKLAKRLVKDPRVDVLMHRYNMAHRKAAAEVFPSAIEAGTPIIAFTATRWASLMKPHPKWPDAPPMAADCYRFCLAQPAVHIVLMGPKSIDELEQNVAVLTSPPMNDERCNYWAQFGDIVYNHGRGDADEFESLWP